MSSQMTKIPPQNVEAEQSVLGSLLLDKEALNKVADFLKAEDFYRSDHADIYRAILKLYEKRKPLDVLTLTDYLETTKKLKEVGGASYLATLVNSVPTAANVVTYAQIIQHKATLRRLISVASKISELGYDETTEVESVLDMAESSLFGVSQNYIKQYFTPIKDILADSFDRIDKLHRDKGTLRGISTGLRDLDNLTAGLQQSDLIIVAARPSLGKSSLALNFADHIACDEKVPVGIFSLEMSKEQVIDRLLCSRGSVDSWKLRTGNLDDEDFGKLNYAMGMLSEAPLFIDDSPIINVMEIRTKARRLQAEHGLGLIIIDYLQLLQGGSGRFDGRVQEVSEISRNLKSLARELNVPVVALSQLSRSVEHRDNKRPMLSDLRESGCLAGDTLIMRADTGELAPIHSLVGQKNIPVYSLNQNWQLEKQNIQKVFSSGRKKIFEIQMRSGRTIKASANHPFLTVAGWQRLDRLKTGGHLAMPRILGTTGKNEIKNEELILLAHLLGDGCVLPRQPIHYTSADLSNLDIVAESAQKLFQIKPRLVKQKNWYHLYLPSPYHLTHGKHHPITNWFKKMQIKPVRSFEKILPSEIFTLSENQIRLFLHHLWATDGNVSWKKLVGRKISAAIYYASTSQKLINQLQHLLLRLGILSTTKKVLQGRFRPIYQLHVQGRAEQLHFLKLVSCFGERGKVIPAMIEKLEQIENNPNVDIIPKEIWEENIAPAKVAAGLSWRGFSSKIETAYCGSTLFQSGLSRERLQRVAVALKDENLNNLALSSVFWDEIIAIEPLGTEEVFDAEVPGTHNFVANDFIVHNSIEQDADIVMFLYRDDYYDKETENQNIAELLIKKHRNGPTGDIGLFWKPEYMRFSTLDKKLAPSE